MRLYRNFYSFVILLIIAFQFYSCQLSRFIFYNFANITDYKIFPSNPLHNDSAKFIFSTSSNGKFPKTITYENNKDISLDKFLESNKSVAFIIIKNDTIQYEKYFYGYDQSSIVSSFSMAKSVTSVLIGCAIDDGLIQSVDEPITNYITELKKNGFEKVQIKHLLQMTSGIKSNENYVNPFGDVADYYYGRNLRKEIRKLKTEIEPGKKFKYISINTELLGLILERALKTKTVTQYLQEKIWQPIGMEFDASWSIDRKKNGLEKTFCCLNARARDFAKIGRLYLNNGNWNGKQIVSENWVQESTHTDTSEGGARYYKYQWWLPSNKGDFLAAGILGQFIYVNPEKKLIIVRLGKKDGSVDWWNIFKSLAANY